ncbi:M20/M25/M40 family metallo-hydrolase [Undibacterium sp.]|uniref:M20/M25/M40 family metallo-hydrolase n=1 Tax=Undibacterium sp. TaxID=1914977 RepID=UPI002C34B538|nr:M20/M25/M40 family metallo-hydrolase [Undibacterium sp.]HTD02184.1 M20/M25/M40 family metallo-hydrolase [Undibacterium sp.]
MITKKYSLMPLLIMGTLAGVSLHAVAADAASKAAGAINGDELLQHIKVLASDDFEGRGPASNGEVKTVAYITEQFKKLGLAPGNPDGSYVQKVPLLGTTSAPTLSLDIGGKVQNLRYPDDFVAWSPLAKPEIKIQQSELVFVGYGVIAPEYGWDDYKGMDMHGKTLVMLINDPAIPDPKHPGQLDPKMFKGKEMTYYGRWTYKFEMAAKLGAAAALIVHETKPASYPYEVVKNSWGRENFNIYSEGANPDFPAVPGWIPVDRAKELFSANGLDFEAMKKAALSKDFKPVKLGTTASYTVSNRFNKVDSNNVVAKIEGSDPALKDEYIIYTAHWDHLGINQALPGPRSNQIYHGALDNASGVASLLELAKAYKALPVAPKRSILFIATTSEEQGLLGARYYARNPLYPLAKTLIDINIDGVNPWGKTRDVKITGYGKSSADDLVQKIAKTQGRTTSAEARPENGGFYRGDQFEFAKVGVPVIYAGSGTQFIGKSPKFALEKSEDYTAHSYHKVSDVVNKDWDFSGVVEDTRLLFEAGYAVAQGKAKPEWKADAEFKAARDGSLQAAGKAANAGSQ